MAPVLIVLGVLLLVLIAAVVIHNGLIGARNRADEAWSGIDVQLKRRHDLVPNLVSTVQGYATHEAKLFEAVTAARAAAVQATGPAAQGQAESALTRAIAPINALAEQYPQLRATENFQRLQAELTQLEDEIQASRRLYNNNVQRYQTRKQQFPASVIAGMGDFPDKELFALDDAADRAVPTVSFSS